MIKGIVITLFIIPLLTACSQAPVAHKKRNAHIKYYQVATTPIKVPASSPDIKQEPYYALPSTQHVRIMPSPPSIQPPHLPNPENKK